jgi:cardiolipin synthase
MWQEWLWVLSGWLYAGLVTVCLLVALLRRREPSAALGWSLAIVFLPGAGPLLFLLFGWNRIPRRLRKKMAHHAGFGSLDEYKSGIAQRAEGRWGEVNRLVTELGEAPRRTGNSTLLLHDGPSAFANISEAVEAATDHIHIEYYIFRHDEMGKLAMEQLKRKLAQGVKVRMIVDAIGTSASRRLLQELRAAGGEGALFLPVGIIGKRASINLRNHRKIVVVDGHTAFFGGLNVGEEYMGTAGRKHAEWFDLHMRVQGPAVHDIQGVFIEDWDFCTSERLIDTRYFPPVGADGPSAMQVVSGGPDVEYNAIRDAFLAAFGRARRHLLVATPYFVPDRALLDALRVARLSGAEVDVVTQAPPPDNWLAYFAAYAYIEELLRVGVRVHGYTPGMMHAKASTMDGEFAMLGSANLDNRSMHLNFELMGLLDSPEDVAAIEAQIRGLIARSTPYTLEGLADRSRLAKLATAVSRLLSPLL